MKVLKRILVLTLAVAMVACTAACGSKNGGANGDSKNYDLLVKYYSGAYGDDWIKLAVEEFEKEKGVKVQAVPSSDMDCGAENNLTAGKNLADVYIGSSSRWQSWVQNGYVENLKSVYDSTVKTSNGDVKISDYIDAEVVGRSYIERQVGTGDSYPWIVPFTAMPMSLAYNNDVLKKIPHTSSASVSAESVDASTNKWIAPPKNLSEWMALCDDINAYKSNDKHKYVPFGWSALALEQVYYFMFTWWAQYQGLFESNVSGQGSFYDFWNFGNTSKTTLDQTFSSNVFDQKGIAASLDNFKKLVIDSKTGSYKNSLSAVNTLSTQELTRALYAERNEERPVIAFASSFGESEARLTGVLDSNSDGKQDSDIRFMNIPALDGHENEKYLYCAYDDLMFIPSGAAHKDLAKEFLVFLCSEDQLKKFTVRSGGGIRPFNYDAREIKDDSLTAYNKSVFDVYYNSKVNGELIQSYYYDGVVDGAYNGTALSNQIIISIPAGNSVTAIPFVEEYEDYDEIGYEDLLLDGNPLGNQTTMSGGTVFTYNKTSPTGSVILKYRWKIGTVPKFQLSFDRLDDTTTMSYMFGAWMYEPNAEEGHPNGKIWLRPSFGPEVKFDTAFAPNTLHNVEFARLKVKTGPNAGRYYVYLKIDDELIEDDYVDANVVDANGNYTSNSGKAFSLSNEILFTFWGTENNVITLYREPGSNVHDGIVGDFDNNKAIDADDLVTLKKILLGVKDTSEMLEGIADFNNDGDVNILDFIAMNKHCSPVNTYAKQGSLALGTQEHLLEDNSKTAEYIAEASEVLGATAYRLSKPIHSLYYVTSSNGVAEKAENMAAFEDMVEALEAKGITEILYVTDSFILPYNYGEKVASHNKTVPDPITDPENYIAWLTVNAEAFKALAQKFPQIKFFEPYNEINVSQGSRLETPGINWNASETEQAAHKYSIKERAGIMADLCWYISKAVKSVDPANQVTTPSLSVDTNHTHVEGEFLDELYKAIESGAYPTNKSLADTRIDNYFTIINIHSYPEFTHKGSSYEQQSANNFANRIKVAYDVVKAHNDGGSRVWLTETGMASYHPDLEPRDEQTMARIINMALQKLDSELTFVDTVFFYQLGDESTDGKDPSIECYYGLFYAFDDLDQLFTLEYRPPYKPKKFPLEDELRKLDFSIEHSYDAATVLVDTVFYLVITVIQIVAELADVMLLSPDLRAAEKDLKEFIGDYHFLQKHNIHTAADLQANIEQSKSELSTLEHERSGISNRIRRPKSPEEKVENKERRKTVSRQMKPVRERLRRAERILEKSPHLYELLKQEHKLEKKARARYKERGR